MAKRRNKQQQRERRPAAVPTPETTPPEKPEATLRARRLDALCLVAIVVLSSVVYANVLGNGLVQDGLSALTHAKNVRDPFDLSAVFLEPYRFKAADVDPAGNPDRAGAYRPLTTWSLAWTYAANEKLGLKGAHPVGHHLLDVLLFAVVSGLVFVLARDVLGASRLTALTTAALFAVHPIHTEVVNLVVGRAELLAALFGLAFLWAHARGARPWTCAALYAAALLGKESAVGFLAVAVAQDLLVAPAGTWRRRLTHYGGYMLVGVLWWWGLRAKAIGGEDLAMSPTFSANVLAHVDGVTRFLTALRVQLDYLLLQTIPVGLASDYSFAQIRPVESIVDVRVLGFLLVLGGAVALAWRLRRARPRLALALFGYAALFAPTSNLLFAIGTIMGERLAFAPSIFFCLLVGEGVDALRARARRPLRIGAAVVLSVFAVLTIQRNLTWSDPAAFSRARVEDAPQSASAHYLEARERQQAGEREQALFHLRRAYELHQGSGYEVAVGFEELGEPDAALPLYRELLERNPRVLPARKRLIRLLLKKERFDEAQALVDELGRLAPGSMDHVLLDQAVKAHIERATRSGR